MNNLIAKVKNRLVYLFDSIVWLIQDIINLFRPNTIFVCGFFKRGNRGIKHNNWGDDINILFFESITNLNIKVVNNSHFYRLFMPDNYSCVGSIIGYFTNRKTIIWGSGLISENIPIPYCPKEICSVRGPLTRAVLLNNGIACPEKYGDPALLVSRFYRPKMDVKYKLGIIPHVVDFNNEIIQSFAKSHPDVLVISMSDYNDWRDIPDQIMSCERIISSSLHGLIISDSYEIPNIWIQLSSDIVGGSFKYRDYFASVGRNEETPFFINTLDSLETLYLSGDFMLAKNIDYMSILQECPFKEYINDYETYAENICNSTSV